MKTLIFNGSPRKNGDTVSLLRYLSERLPGEIKTITAYDGSIGPCIDCRYCWKNSGCAVKDRMQEVYRDIEDCDNIVIASPVYFSELTGPLLSVASRLQTYYCALAFRKEIPIKNKKKGAVILVGGGDGRMDRAYKTAAIMLHHMNAFDIFPLVSSHRTNVLPAIEDENALKGIREMACFFRQDSTKTE